MSSSKRGPLVCTGAQVLKGALVEVLGVEAGVTTKIDYDSLKKGTISIQWTEQITPELSAEIESVANRIVARNVPVQTLTMSRAEAEEKFRSGPLKSIYNGDAPAPEVTELKLVVIDGVSVNATDDPQCATTGFDRCVERL